MGDNLPVEDCGRRSGGERGVSETKHAQDDHEHCGGGHPEDGDHDAGPEGQLEGNREEEVVVEEGGPGCGPEVEAGEEEWREGEIGRAGTLVL